jgi:predicted RNA-binding protein with PIN domain
VDGPSTLLRPALELACAVAREGARRQPAIAIPRPMRPLVRFAHLPDRALDAVRRVVDEDEELRARVARAADEQTLGRVPWLWLVRPAGWADEVAAAIAGAVAASQDEEDSRAEGAARRQLARVEASLRRAEAELAEIRASAAAVAAELALVRQQRRVELEAAARDRAALIAAKEAGADAARRAMDSEVRRAAAEERLAVNEERLAESAEANAHVTRQLVATRHALAVAVRDKEVADDRAAARVSEAGRAIGEATLAAKDLGGALGRAALALDGGADVASASASVEGAALSTVRTEPPNRGKGDPGETGGGRPRRRPTPLPRAVFDDSPDAAAWLVRLPGVILLVDGYNVTLGAWSGQDLADQRHRLVTALAELSMRTGVEVEVVFDGDENHAHPLRSMPARRAVRVTFSPPAVDADEVIIARVGELPATRPVIVATDDRRVRDACNRAGANLLSTEQLVAALGRTGGARPTGAGRG